MSAPATWEARVQRVCDHVRADLRGDLSLAALARRAHASAFHFARRFKAVTGETPARFVQRARLERAATLMRARPDRALGDIATEVGFGAVSDFSRVFKQHHGVPPSRWDRKSRLGDALPAWDDGLAAAREACPPLQARTVRHDACRLAYVRVPTPFLDAELLAAGYAELTHWFEGHGVDWREQRLVGMSWDHPEVTPLERVRYDLGFTLPSGLRADGPVTEQALPALRAVEVHVRGPLPYIALAWEHLYEHWLPRARSEPLDLPGMKRFRRRPDELGWTEFDLHCSIALT